MNYCQVIFLFLELDNFMNVRMIHAYTQPKNQEKNAQKLGSSAYEDLCGPTLCFAFSFL